MGKLRRKRTRHRPDSVPGGGNSQPVPAPSLSRPCPLRGVTKVSQRRASPIPPPIPRAGRGWAAPFPATTEQNAQRRGPRPPGLPVRVGGGTTGRAAQASASRASSPVCGGRRAAREGPRALALPYNEREGRRRGRSSEERTAAAPRECRRGGLRPEARRANLLRVSKLLGPGSPRSSRAPGPRVRAAAARREGRRVRGTSGGWGGGTPGRAGAFTPLTSPPRGAGGGGRLQALEPREGRRLTQSPPLPSPPPFPSALFFLLPLLRLPLLPRGEAQPRASPRGYRSPRLPGPAGRS